MFQTRGPVMLKDRSPIAACIYMCDFCYPGVVHHISRLSIQDRVLDLSVKKDNGSLCSQSVDRSASTSATSAGLSVRRSDVPDKPSSPLPHLYVALRLVFIVRYICEN